MISEGLSGEGWLQGVQQSPSPNFNERPDPEDISLLVIHSISLPPGEYGNHYIDDFFCNKLDCSTHPYFREIEGLEVSSHLLISRDGEIKQYVSFFDRAWHAGQSIYEGRENCNDFSIGIELEGLEGESFESVQYERLAEVCSYLIEKFPKLNKQRICGHSDIAPGRKFDPGEGFDWNRFLDML